MQWNSARTISYIHSCAIVHQYIYQFALGMASFAINFTQTMEQCLARTVLQINVNNRSSGKSITAFVNF